MADANASITLLRERIGSVDALLAETLSSWPAQLARLGRGPNEGALPAEGAVIATGTGGSEGPARYLITRLGEQARRPCRFAPSSAFIHGPPLASPERATLVVFSQGLSKNARIALRQAHRFARCILVTAVSAEGEGETNAYLRTLHRRGVYAMQHGPAQESGLLVRVIGPAVATLCAELLAASVDAQQSVLSACEAALTARARYRVTPSDALDPYGLCALITTGAYQPYVQGLRWKLLESLGESDPPVWDALQLAHGPLQALYRERATLVVLRAAAERATEPLIERVRGVLVQDRHRLFVIEASCAAPLCWFEHDAALNQLLLETLARHPRDLANWPAKGMDGPLYEYAGDEGYRGD